MTLTSRLCVYKKRGNTEIKVLRNFFWLTLHIAFHFLLSWLCSTRRSKLPVFHWYDPKISEWLRTASSTGSCCVLLGNTRDLTLNLPAVCPPETCMDSVFGHFLKSKTLPFLKLYSSLLTNLTPSSVLKGASDKVPKCCSQLFGLWPGWTENLNKSDLKACQIMCSNFKCQRLLFFFPTEVQLETDQKCFHSWLKDISRIKTGMSLPQHGEINYLYVC